MVGRAMAGRSLRVVDRGPANPFTPGLELPAAPGVVELESSRLAPGSV